MCLDRGVRLAGLLGDESAPAHRWRRAADEVRVLGTVDRVIEELCDGDLVHRYSPAEVDDGLPGEEGSRSQGRSGS
ncbi:hypothetical protein [Nonomuraea sp. C10]|uniref:hypothetical protein n=1 Tax=Nonomuraea sp. C10 TaxID=2600577 RepID=UPI0011CD7022|nr:hypothetical protein [Nonomuraea sp. C10]TXK39107.1 hypothetical protein FR742_05510 [Nonomuraea sp. C10]